MVDTEEITMIQGLVQAIKDQFKNKLIIEDRKPIYQYQYNDDTTFVVLAPKYEFYHQLILVRYCLFLIHCSLSLRSVLRGDSFSVLIYSYHVTNALR